MDLSTRQKIIATLAFFAFVIIIIVSVGAATDWFGLSGGDKDDETTTPPVTTTPDETNETTTPPVTTTPDETTTPPVTTTPDETTTPPVTTNESAGTTPPVTTNESAGTTPPVTTNESAGTTPPVTTTNESAGTGDDGMSPEDKKVSTYLRYKKIKFSPNTSSLNADGADTGEMYNMITLDKEENESYTDLLNRCSTACSHLDVEDENGDKRQCRVFNVKRDGSKCQYYDINREDGKFGNFRKEDNENWDTYRHVGSTKDEQCARKIQGHDPNHWSFVKGHFTPKSHVMHQCTNSYNPVYDLCAATFDGNTDTCGISPYDVDGTSYNLYFKQKPVTAVTTDLAKYNKSPKDCAKACNARDDCGGFIYDKSDSKTTNYCRLKPNTLKERTMVPQEEGSNPRVMWVKN